MKYWSKNFDNKNIKAEFEVMNLINTCQKDSLYIS